MLPLLRHDLRGSSARSGRAVARWLVLTAVLAAPLRAQAQDALLPETEQGRDGVDAGPDDPTKPDPTKPDPTHSDSPPTVPSEGALDAPIQEEPPPPLEAGKTGGEQKKEPEAFKVFEDEKAGVEITAFPGKGLTVAVGDLFSFNLRSRLQLRYQLGIPRADESGERELDHIVNIGTARLWFSGHVFFPELTYMLQLAVAGRDYREGAVSPIFDAFVDWKAHRDFSLRIGQFFVPFDRLRTVREFALQMADRPRPITELTLDRDVGILFYSDKFLDDKSPVAYRLGVFGGGGTNLTESKEPGALFVARAELRPLGPIDDDSEGDLDRRVKPGLAIGGAFAGNWSTNRARSTTGTIFTGGTTDYYHAAADVVFKWFGLALQGEYLYRGASVDSIVSTNPDGTEKTEWTRSGHGWIVQASYTFDPPIEIVARVSGMHALEGTDPKYVTEIESRGGEIGAGLNYYINGHKLKLQADWIARMPLSYDLTDADHVVHVQADATF